ncbi:precorrin-6y C5,15-methyltransferase (decarboxylating) subunit CbiE [Mangrovicoccus sp. HB161399]|uniref:precorrin-6y C5,15-methyltransferase (decarboxylating) subunit CbiE n=1 Tax=Mangrovicoccus sp. HB161399 TaxID=2720392 RepID=UPI00155276CF|nr:precorrin-6y C5,15-methyltransferase (decarboxylating) subunit CbiE [Mangrovicoccus sp. HB161399]
MTAPWLDIIGLGEDGLPGLSPAARTRLETAEVVYGAPRHHALAPGLRGERRAWPSPFSALEAEIAAMRGRPVAVLVTGDPIWFSAGTRFLKAFPREELTLHPQLSAFQWAAARMGWGLADAETLTVHGRPAEQILPFLAPGQRLLVLTRDGSSPAEIADLLFRAGFGPSRLSVLAHLGGPEESRIDATAEAWEGTAPDLHVLAIDCRSAPDHVPLPLTGLPDDAFIHDGKMTKQEIRAVTLSALAPRRGAVLWDIGLGCGSVAIEWMRAARDAQAIGIEPLPARISLAAANAARLGAPRLKIVEGKAPEALADLPAPDAVFIGGGLSGAAVEASLAALKPYGRLVANAVTLESEALLLELHARHGGTLRRISVARAEPVGPFRGWKPAMPVTQWSLTL